VLSFPAEAPTASTSDTSIRATNATSSGTGGRNARLERDRASSAEIRSSVEQRSSARVVPALSPTTAAAVADTSSGAALVTAPPGVVGAQFSGRLKGVAECKCKLKFNLDFGADVQGRLKKQKNV